MSVSFQLNERCQQRLQSLLADPEYLRVGVSELAGATILDFGVHSQGGLQAGILLAELCLSGLGQVELQSPELGLSVPQVCVRTDHPVQACLLSQYAGWKIATDSYFAMGSGPMRATAAVEDLFKEFSVDEDRQFCIGVLEAGSVPDESAIAAIRRGVGDVQQLTIAVAPTASQAGNLQVVARSVETALHKLHELHFPLNTILSGFGTAPLPPVAKNDLAGIGRTNDSILYGATVNLWVDCDDDVIQQLGPQTPSSSSDSHGRPFLELFKEANHDFYALDKALFSPAVVVFHSVTSGRSFRFGTHMPELILASFGM